MGIVCRPLHLYNEFLPAEIKNGRDWEYQAFGHHDGISVGNRILLNNADSFEELFDYCVKYEMEDSYFNQIVWGFHEDAEQEQAFWEKKEYPFLYLVLLQVADKENNYRKIKEKLNSMYCQSENSERSVLFYYSIDNSDLMMIIRSKKAELGFDVVNELHYDVEGLDFKIRNTYSILGVLRKAIDEETDLISEDEKIALLELQIIEKERGSLDSLYKELTKTFGDDENKIFRKVVLGTEDDAIFIRDLYWRELLPFYRSETGILNNSNEATQCYAYAISSRVMMREKNSYDTNKMNKPEPIKSPFCDMLSGIVKKKTVGVRTYQAETKTLLLIINSFRRFEYQNDKDRPFTDYNFFPLFMPFYQFVKIADVQEVGFSKYYYHFMKCMKICTQNFTKPERIYSQITDFNIRYFDMPVKLITLYNAYIYSIKQVLNISDEKNIPSYEFMVCAGLNGNTEVKELFLRQEYDRRLFLIETPERQMYQTKLMFFVLGHEVAHFVGKSIRNRDGRTKQILQVCSRAISVSMKSYYEYGENCKLSLDTKKWERVESYLEEWLRFYMERNINREYLKEVEYYNQEIMTEEHVKECIEFNEKYAFHSDILQYNLVNAISDMLSSKGVNIFNFAIADEYKSSNSKSNVKPWNDFLQEKREGLRRYINAFLGISVNSDTSLTIEKIIGKIVFWMKECYADIICILMLRVSLKDYIDSFVSVSVAQGVNGEELSQQDLVIRIALVMAAMSYPLEHINIFRWTDTEYRDYEDWSEECRNIEDAANEFMEDYITNEYNFAAEELIKNPFKIFCDQSILNSILQYLLECIVYFTNKIECNKKLKGLDQVRRFYKMSEINDSVEFFKEMMLLLKEYEKNVYMEMGKIIVTEEK